MAESAAYARRTTKGGCAQARIAAGVNIGATTATADDLSSWAGAVANGPTHAMLGRQSSTPEEVEISAISGNDITFSARGLNGTSETQHGADVTIDIIVSPRDLDEANKLVNAILGIPSLAAGDIFEMLTATTLKRIAKGTAWQVFAMNQAATGHTHASGYPLFVFANATARDAAITSPTEGMFAWLTGTDALTYYTGSAWAAYSSGAASTPVTATVATSQTTTSTSFTDLTTAGPAVTPTVPASGVLTVAVTANMANNTNATHSLMSFALSGGNTVAAADVRSSRYVSSAGGEENRSTLVVVLAGLTPGSTTVTVKYRCNGGTSTFYDREISAW